MDMNGKRILRSLLVALLVAGFYLGVYIQRNVILDWLVLRNYQPASSISTLASDDTMTPYGKKLFYVNKPMLEDRNSFSIHCPNKSEKTIVEGCYRGNRQGIFIFAVSDPRLAGIQQVTAAHEMLHQAYDRLSGSDKKRIDSLLQNYYNTLPPGDLKAKIDSYKGQKDENLVNEMHSIFGTEVRTLPKDLETYYKQYFSNRLKVVTYSETYQGEFIKRKAQVAQYDAQLAELKPQIDANKADLESRLATLKSKEAEINQDAAAGNTAEYNADVTTYNQMVNAYNAKLTATKALIQQYNAIVEARNALAVEEQSLQQAIDSRQAPSTIQ